MNAALRIHKDAIRTFMRQYYTDERLAMLLAHAQSGQLAYCSCCCLIGIPTASHALKGSDLVDPQASYQHPHYYEALNGFSRAGLAGNAYAELCRHVQPVHPSNESDPVRRRILIPMIRAEMKRRDALKAEPCEAVPTEQEEMVAK